jgi:hypothetical protein
MTSDGAVYRERARLIAARPRATVRFDGVS